MLNPRGHRFAYADDLALLLHDLCAALRVPVQLFGCLHCKAALEFNTKKTKILPLWCEAIPF